ncbi:transglycosylase SLT domain-containing protein [Oryzihumus leptocrescens]|uniref:Cell wall-associated NlpC family hydrolase n=1 Tax=Oryzihumus leptocrescens TaxID=297536 RepID=A0A542Z9R4_9MICO|nr:transglycosylase SLT domain-containing protein [Oryzihumus leptocrescens]TQL56980.1 cell wall-associated NlpC family hydrolase [Oryzihumus leptocrescens]
MSVDLSGLVAVQSRMLTIQSRFATVSGATPAAGSSDTFASRLAAATADTGTDSTVGGADPASATTSATGDQVVADARRYLGVPYVWGGTDPQQGLDCSGLVQRVYADLGVDLPRVAADQASQGTPVASLAQARPGDLLAFGDPVDHIGIYAGNGQMVVAPKTGDVVKVEAVYRTPTAIRRILPDTATASTAYAGAATGALAAAPAAYRDLFTAAAARHGVPASLLASVARAESGFNPSAVSHAGALGLMQLMPGTARSLGVNPLDPGQAVDGAARLLAQDLRTFGSTELAVAAYNAGPDAVRSYGGVPPYAETRAYVQRVLAYQNGGVA